MDAPRQDFSETRTKHGRLHWRDARIECFSHDGGEYLVPAGWFAVGALDTASTRASFPKSQTAVWVNPAYFDRFEVRDPRLPVPVLLTLPRAWTGEARQALEREIRRANERVASLFPLGFAPADSFPIEILVTSGLIGASSDLGALLAPAAGPRLTVIYLPMENPRWRELYVHTTVHQFNRRRARSEALGSDAFLPVSSYQEMVATWMEFAADTSAVRRMERFEEIVRDYQAVLGAGTRGRPKQPLLGPLLERPVSTGLTSLRSGDAAASEFEHYFVAPLAMLAVDGLLTRQHGAPTLESLLREVHRGSQPNLRAALQARLDAGAMRRVDAWLRGSLPLPLDLARLGVARLSNQDDRQPR